MSAIPRQEEVLWIKDTTVPDALISSAAFAQDIKTQLRNCKLWQTLSPEQRENADRIASNLGRMLSSEPSIRDTQCAIMDYANVIALSVQFPDEP